MNENNLDLNTLIDQEIVSNNSEIQKLITKAINHNQPSPSKGTQGTQYVHIDQNNGIITTSSDHERKIIANFIQQNKPNEQTL